MTGRREFLIAAGALVGAIPGLGKLAVAQTGYSTTVKVWNLEGGSGLNVTAQLWMLWPGLGSGPGSGPQQLTQGSDAHTGVVSSLPISFPLGPSFQSVSIDRGIGVSLQDTALVSSGTGWWFRSGRFDTLPADYIEVVLVPAQVITPAQIAGMLPTTPFTADADTSTTIIALSVTLMDPTPGSGFTGGFVRLIATGTTKPAPLVAPVAFTYALNFQVVPSGSIETAASEPLEIFAPSRGSIVFASVGISVSGSEALLLDVLQGAALSKIFPLFRDRLQAIINAGAVASAANVIGPGNTNLPPGVILSVRTLQTRATSSTALMPGLTVRAALGAYGGVIPKFPKPTTTSPSPTWCMATAAAGANSQQVAVLQRFRDEHLLRSSIGRRFVALYNRCSPPIAEKIRRNSVMRLCVRWSIVRPAAAVARLILFHFRR